MKKINLVYEWIGPRGPITNNRIPTIIDLIDQYVIRPPDTIKSDFHHLPHFYQRCKSQVNIVSASTLPTTTFLYEINFGSSDYRDILHIFHNQDGLLDQNNITPEVLSRVRARQAFILFTVLHESWFDDGFLMSMTHYFSYKQIPLSQIIYVSHCANGTEIYKDHCTRYNINPEIQMEYIPTTRIDRTDIDKISLKYIPGLRKKTFLCFNRRHHAHRLIFFMMMVKRKLLDNFFMSMSKVHPESRQTFTHAISHVIQNHNQYSFTIDDIATGESILPLVLDTKNFNSYPMELSPADLKKYYNDSLVNIVTETFFFSNVIHVTEKTYKPIAYLQPFIMIAAPNSLQHVRDMGFKTFNEFWDESYDTETDHVIRFNKIFDLIESISKWSDKKKIQFSYQVKEILEYNAAHLYNIKNIELDKIVEKYGI